MSDIYLNGGSKKIILNGTTYFASGGGGGSTPTLITKTITENGTYSAEDDSADGYSEVTVDVSGVEIETITQTEYDALTQEEKENGTVYLIEAVSSVLDMSDATINRQNSGIAISLSSGSVSTTRPTSGSQIGCNVSKGIDLTNIDSITFDTYTDTAYGDGDADNDLRLLSVSVGTSALTNSYVLYTSHPAQMRSYAKANAVWLNERLDVSNLIGTYYFNINANGWNMSIRNIELNSNDAKLMYLDEEYTKKNLKQHGVNYEWYSNQDETLVVRLKLSDGSFRWYFNGVYVPTSPFLSIPGNLSSFIKNGVIVGCKKHELDSYRNDPMVGFYSNTLRVWTQGLGGNASGKIWAIMESSDTGSNTYPDQCYHAWEEPSFDPING